FSRDWSSDVCSSDLQSTLYDKYAVGGGLEHKYLDIRTDNLPNSDPNRRIENSYFLSAYGYIKADNLDNPNFPRDGLKLDGSFKRSEERRVGKERRDR